MKVVRCRDSRGFEAHAAAVAAGYERLEGSWAGGWKPTGELIEPAEWLPPVEPAAILCVGLNYRRHAEETGAKLPPFPVLFMKNPAAAIG
ncbi:MAG: hypothetical protein N2322_08140, partial [Terrimicrobiaceae bacterium]|nr:hypothetical protein [Terrimicrobiaceae bacterium]